MNLFINSIIWLTVSTIIGAYIGIFTNAKNQKKYNVILAFSVGIMLYACYNSLIIQAFFTESKIRYFTAILGIISGTFFISIIDSVPDKLSKAIFGDIKLTERQKSVLIFVSAIAIHKIPEGLACGVSCRGLENSAICLTMGIAIQNIPDGLIVSSPLRIAGVNKTKSFLIGALTALFSIIGIIIGYVFAGISAYIVNFALAFAAGMILDVCFLLIKEIDSSHSSVLSLSAGTAIMLILEKVI